MHTLCYSTIYLLPEVQTLTIVLSAFMTDDSINISWFTMTKPKLLQQVTKPNQIQIILLQESVAHPLLPKRRNPVNSTRGISPPSTTTTPAAHTQSVCNTAQLIWHTKTHVLPPLIY